MNTFNPRCTCIIALFLLATITSFGQAPANDNCANAISLTVGTSCVSVNYSNEEATAESTGVAPNPTCGYYAGGDVWFTAVMPLSGALRIESRNLDSSIPPSVNVYSGSCGSFTDVVCYGNDRNKTIHSPSLAGQTVYIRMYSYNSEEGHPFSICVFEPAIPPNDNCADAIALTVGTTCQNANYSNEYATKESLSVAPNPTCGYYNGGDVWFTAVMPSSGSLRIESDNLNASTPLSVNVYSGSCGSFTDVLCYGNDRNKTINSPSLAGQTIYIRMYSYNSEEGHPFSICIFEPTIPPNDNCADAIALPVGTTCQNSNYSNEYATKESLSVAPNPTCGYYNGGDVWFTAVMPSSGSLRIESDNLNASMPLSVNVYSGSCGSFTDVVCYGNDRSKTINSPSLAGQTVYIRMYSYNSEEGHPFSICLFEPTIPPNDNCADAIALTVGTTCQNSNYSNEYATKESLSVAPNPTCGYYNGGDVWFTAVVPSSGSLRIESDNLNASTPLSVNVYSGSCGSFTNVVCYSNDGSQTIHSPSLAGQTIYIRMYSYNSEEGHPFSICVFDPTIPPNDNCADAIPLSVEESCQPLAYTNVFATSESTLIAEDPSCRHYSGGDVWFTTVMPASGVLYMELKDLASSMIPSLSVYTGACGAFTEVGCFNLNSKPIINNTALAGETLYLRVYSFSSDEGSPFSLCLYDPGCEPVIEEQTQAICEGEVFLFGGEELTESGTYSYTVKMENGCDSLVNLTLTVHPVYHQQDTVVVCYGQDYTFPDGYVEESITAPLEHTSSLLTQHQCDSIITTVVEVQVVDASVSQDGAVLTAVSLTGDIQWLDCDNNMEPIVGATEHIFTAAENGAYAVRILQEGCVSVSACYSVIVLDSGEERAHDFFEVYPNPSARDIVIKLKQGMRNASVELINLAGQSVFVENAKDQTYLVYNTDGLSAGTYLLRIRANGRYWVARQVIIR